MIHVHLCPTAQIIELEPNRRFKLSQRHHLRVYGQQLLQQHYAERLVFAHDALGKPIILNQPNLYFNQSHSQDLYALTWADHVIGIDIEPLNRQANFDQLAERYFHPAEQAYWSAYGQSAKLWLKIWTIKEAIVKAHGIGIRLKLNTLNTQNSAIDDHFGRVQHPALGDYDFQTIETAEHYVTLAYPSDSQKKTAPLPILFL